MILLHDPDESLIVGWQQEISNWPEDSNWVADGAFHQYQMGDYHCIVAIDSQKSLVAVSTYVYHSIDEALALVGIAKMVKREPNRLRKIYADSDLGSLQGREIYNKKVDEALSDYPIFDSELTPQLPQTALYIEALAGIGNGGAGAILRHLISNNKLIFVEMLNSKNNFPFYKHFGFKQIPNTKYMYLLS